MFQSRAPQQFKAFRVHPMATSSSGMSPRRGRPRRIAQDVRMLYRRVHISGSLFTGTPFSYVAEGRNNRVAAATTAHVEHRSIGSR